jgi:hypothetical protein
MISFPGVCAWQVTWPVVLGIAAGDAKQLS